MEPGGSEQAADICDFCGQLLGGDACLDLVPDSSAVHAHDPAKDGLRLVVACSAGHLEELREEYRRRPFLDEELFAGKITRALRAHPQGLSRRRLARLTGLRPAEIERAMAWKNARIRRWREQYGEGWGEDSPGEDASPR
ncbi:hypothetical protein [Streptomyces sp. ODS28]|uniref:hypothetical protein n=1 Tax=Streptomyces sp. ODS28 TaxID=3136688 RepID=UPI0031EA8057